MDDSTDDFLRRLIDGDPSLGILAEAPPQHRKRFATGLLMEREAAQEADMLGYQARILVQCSLPYRQLPTNEWTRRNGGITLTLMAPSAIGLPYGAYPRLILTWATTEAVRTQSRILDIHHSLTRFMANLGIAPHANGREIRRFKEQTRRLFSTTVSTSLTNNSRQVHDMGFRLASELRMWWEPIMETSADSSRIVLSHEFFHVITDGAIPLDLRAITALKGSALALDIYSWLVHRLSYLKKPTVIPWELLQMQFGGEYADTKQGRYEFKRKFQAQLAEVLRLYPEAKVTADNQGLTLRPSRLAIDRRRE